MMREKFSEKFVYKYFNPPSVPFTVNWNWDRTTINQHQPHKCNAMQCTRGMVRNIFYVQKIFSFVNFVYARCVLMHPNNPRWDNIEYENFMLSIKIYHKINTCCNIVQYNRKCGQNILRRVEFHETKNNNSKIKFVIFFSLAKLTLIYFIATFVAAIISMNCLQMYWYFLILFVCCCCCVDWLSNWKSRAQITMSDNK